MLIICKKAKIRLGKVSLCRLGFIQEQKTTLLTSPCRFFFRFVNGALNVNVFVDLVACYKQLILISRISEMCSFELKVEFIT